MPLQARIGADFGDFKRALEDIKGKFNDFSSSTTKLQTDLNKLTQSFGGDNIRRQAALTMKAIQDIGGVTKLTTSEQARANTVLAEAVSKYQALGQAAPAALREMAAATKASTAAADQGGVSFGKMASAVATGEAAYHLAVNAGRKMTDFLTECVAEASKADTVWARLTTSMKAQGTYTPALAESYRGLGASLQRTSAYSHDLAEESMALMIQIGNVMPKDMGRALLASENLAAGLGISLPDAAEKVGKAVMGNTRELGRLVPELRNVEKGAGSASAVLDVLNRSGFGGQAAAQVQTYQGRVAQLTNAWSDFEESLGFSITHNKTLLTAIGYVSDGLLAQSGRLDGTKRGLDLVSGSVIALTQGTALLARGFDWVQTAFYAVETSSQMVGRAIAQASGQMFEQFAKDLATMRAMAEFVPGLAVSMDMAGVTKGIALFGSAARDSYFAAAGLTVEIETNRKKSAEWGQGLQDFATKADALAAQLEKTRGQSVAFGDSLVPVARHTGEATGATAEHAKAIAELQKKLWDLGGQYASALGVGRDMSDFMKRHAVEIEKVGAEWLDYGKTVDGTFKGAYDAAKRYSLADALKEALDAAKGKGEEKSGLEKWIDEQWKVVGAGADRELTAWAESQDHLVQISKDYQEKLLEQSVHGTDLRLAQIAREYDATVKSLGKETDENRVAWTTAKAQVDAFYARQQYLATHVVIDWNGVADGISGSLSKGVAAMLTSVGHFKEASIGILRDLGSEFAKVIDDMIGGFLRNFVQKAIGALQGNESAFSGGLAGLFGLGGGGGEPSVATGNLPGFSSIGTEIPGVSGGSGSKTSLGVAMAAGGAMSEYAALSSIYRSGTTTANRLASVGSGAMTGAGIGLIAGGPAGAAIGAGVGAMAGLVATFFSESKAYKDWKAAQVAANEQFASLQQNLMQTYGSMQAIATAGRQVGVDLAGALSLGGAGGPGTVGLKQLQDTIAQFEKLKALASQYQLTWQDLSKDAMTQWGQASIQQLTNDRAALEQQGYSSDAILGKMAGGYNDILKAYLTTGEKLPDVLGQSIKKLAEMGLLTDENKNKLLGLTAAAAVPDFASIQAVVQKYGMDPSKLGKSYAQMEGTATGSQLVTDIGTMTAAGMDKWQVAGQMNPQISALVQQALKYGTALPAELEPIIRTMAQWGPEMLVDSTGNAIRDLSALKFADPVVDATITATEKQTADLIAELDKLIVHVDAAAVASGGAIVAGPEVGGPAGAVYARDASTGAVNGPGYTEGADAVGSYHMGGLVRRFHSGGLASDEMPAILQVGERVLSRRQTAAFDALAKREFGGSDDHRVIHLHNYLDGRQVAEVVVPFVPRVLAAYGCR
jgi:hypothetical protein